MMPDTHAPPPWLDMEKAKRVIGEKHEQLRAMRDEHDRLHQEADDLWREILDATRTIVELEKRVYG